MKIKPNDLKTCDEEYWKKRFLKTSLRAEKEGLKSLKELQNVFKETYNEMDNVVQLFYAKHGEIIATPVFKTLADGTKVITAHHKRLVVTWEAANVKLRKGTRFLKLQQQLKQILMKMSNDQNKIMQKGLKNTIDSMYYSTIHEIYKGVGIGKSFHLLTEAQIKSLMRNPVAGENFSARIWANRDQLAMRVNRELKNGITQGLSNDEMASRIKDFIIPKPDGKKGYAMKSAKSLMNTEINNSMNQAGKIAYEESGIVKEYSYLATLDERTSSICTELDQEVFKLEEAITGLNYPPMHTRCRSTTQARFDNSLKGLTRMARDLEGDNFIVPGDMNVRDFKAIYVNKSITREAWDKGRK